MELNQLNLWIGIVIMVVFKYGVVGFILSKYVKETTLKEAIDALLTFFLIVGVITVIDMKKYQLTNGHYWMNLLYMIIAIGLYYAITIFIGERSKKVKSNNQVEIEQLAHKTPFWLALLSTGIIAPLFEEVIFRFLIQDVIFNRSILGILIASLIFALLHLVAGFSMSALLMYFGASVVIGALYNLTGGILFTALMHMTVNSFAVIMMFYGGKLAERYQDDV